MTTDAGHSDVNQYLASTVQVQTATRTSGPWTTVGTYTLPKSATQVLTLDSPLTLPAGQFLRLNFTKGFSEGGKTLYGTVGSQLPSEGCRRFAHLG